MSIIAPGISRNLNYKSKVILSKVGLLEFNSMARNNACSYIQTYGEPIHPICFKLLVLTLCWWEMPFISCMQNELLYAEVDYMQKRVSKIQHSSAHASFFSLLVCQIALINLWHKFCFQEMDLHSDNMYLRSKVCKCSSLFISVPEQSLTL